MKKRIMGILMSFVLCISAFGSIIQVYAKESTLKINTEEEFIEFMNNCKIDSYSEGLTVVLEKDIALSSDKTAAIPIFAGTFKGNGHTISNFNCSNNGSNLGLFRYVSKGGIVENLNVTGSVEPSGSQCNIGGIVGTNYGKIKNCSFEGNVTGKLSVGGIVGTNEGLIKNSQASGKITGTQFTGGICGYNSGEISDCVNQSSVNIEVQEEGINVEEISEQDFKLLNVLNLKTTDEVSDTGGICGGSKGVIRNSRNSGDIGYQHYGYNVGGITGRQSGYIVNCTNTGTVKGRKDVAGIVGQMEPYLYLLDSQSLVEELEKLTAYISVALDTLAGDSSSMAGTLASLRDGADDAKTYAQQYNEATKKINNYLTSSSEDDSSVSIDDVVNKGKEIVGNAADDYNKVDSDTKDDIMNGDISQDTVDDISGVIQDSDNTGALSQAIKDKKAQKEAEAAEQAAAQQAQAQALANLETSVANKISSVGSSLADLNDNLSGMATDLASALKAVNDQFDVVNHLLTNLLSGDTVNYEDISDLDSEKDTDGKVALCRNNGSIEGDENVGGIAGLMELEVEYKVESDLLDGVSVKSLISKYFESRAVVRNCTNEGTVISRKSHSGGMAGLCNVGAVFYSENYGDISSDGKYVGGIVGDSENLVSGCYSMCSVSGLEYVGGIVGEGNRIENSCANVTIADESTACNGAIAGYVDVTVKDAVVNNYFISDSLGGIDGISYVGLAEPTEFDKLKTIEGLPDLFNNVTVTFIADDKIVATVKVDYGKTIKSKDIPDVPQKKDYEGSWEDISLKDIKKNLTVSAIYTPLQSSVASSYKREGSTLSVILVEGDFDSVVKVDVKPYTKEIKNVNGTQLEALTINVTKDGKLDEYQLRYLAPDKDTNIELYSLNKDGSLTRLTTTAKGSYLTFTSNSKKITIVAVKKNQSTPFVMIVFILLLALLFGLWKLNILKKEDLLRIIEFIKQKKKKD